MKLKPIIAQLEEHIKKFDVYDWGEDNTPQELLDFHELILTSSDNFWYSLNNGYVEISLITDSKLEDLTYNDICKIEEIVDKYGVEF